MLKHVDMTYICHYTKLENRKAITENILSRYNFPYMWVTKFDKEEVSVSSLKDTYLNIDKPLGLGGLHQNRTLRLSEVSLILKNVECWKNIVDNNYSNGLVLEDDIILCDEFVNRFNLQIKDLPKYYDIIWVGSCCDLHIKNTYNDIYLYKHDGSRCTHAYMISNKCARKMLEFVKTNNYPADFMFNRAIKDLNLENYWMEPDLIRQNPTFDTSIQNDISFI